MKETPPQNKATLATDSKTKDPWWKPLTQVILFDNAAKCANDSDEGEDVADLNANHTGRPFRVPDHKDNLPPEVPKKKYRTKEQREVEAIMEEAKRLREMRR